MIDFTKRIGQISRREKRDLFDNAIKVWHFEKTDRGVKPVAGEYDSTNPNHVLKNKVIKINYGLIQE